MEADFSGKRSILFKFGPTIARRFIHLVVTFPSKLDAVGGFPAMETAGDTAEDELAASLAVEGDVSGLNPCPTAPSR